MTITAERLLIAMERRSVSQSKLARGLGVTQGAISKILLGKTTNSRLLPRIAVHLDVSLEWLLGVAASPGEDTPRASPSTETVHVLLPVALPSERALARMFEGLLRVMPADADLVEQARLLARRLPIGLSQLRDLLPEPTVVEPETERELAEALATLGHELRS